MRYYISTFALLSALLCSAQIDQGGRPLMNGSDFSAGKVIYLLEPEDQMIVSALKSTEFNSDKKALQYATERTVDLSPDYNGEWIEKDGMQVWRVHIISPGAYSMGIFFSEFELQKDARIFLYNPSGDVIKGSYNEFNNKKYGTLMVGHIPGEEVIVELQLENIERDYGKIRIGTVSHAFLPVFSKKDINDTGLGTAQDCEIDINCFEGDDWQIVKRSVVYISTGTLLCTGALINNTSYNGKPYILTAEHCINKEFRAQSSVFYFNYENSDCGINDANKNQSISGSNLLATGDSLDFTLVQLSSYPPADYSVYYAGWDAREQNHDLAVAIHHPNADAKKISYENSGTIDALYVTGDLNDYIVASNYRIRKWDIGSTEGGSSGGPLFNASKRIIGNLSGGLAACGDSIGYNFETNRAIYSTTGNEDDFYSKIYYNWDYYSDGEKQLKKWLDPSGSGQLSIGGLNGNSVDVKSSKSNKLLLMTYPNPTNGSFRIDLPSYNEKELDISIYNLTGQKVFQQKERAIYPLNLNMENQTPGVYIIKISGKDTNLSGRIILE